MEKYENFVGLGIDPTGAKQNAELKLDNWTTEQQDKSDKTIIELNRDYDTTRNSDIEWQCEINLKYKEQ